MTEISSAHNHAGRGLVGELGIEFKAQLGEEFHRFAKMLHRQIHKNFCAHFFSPEWDVTKNYLRKPASIARQNDMCDWNAFF